MTKRGINGEFKRNGIDYTQRELLEALLNYKPRPEISGENNRNFKNGESGQYIRIMVRGKKVKRSHIVWMLWNNASRIPEGKDVHHKDGNKKNDAASNLELRDANLHGMQNLRGYKDD